MISRWDSFENAQWYYEDVVQYFREMSRKRPTIVLCGNKTDLEHMRKVPQKVAKEYANSNGVLYMECSALLGINIQEIFWKAFTPQIGYLTNNISRLLFLLDQECQPFWCNDSVVKETLKWLGTECFDKYSPKKLNLFMKLRRYLKARFRR
eukprot:TRINITY_DN3714_c0_g3_i1.p1 TRINITY_DN3714_c0_g3~~TRINITY_DN3714_c0_g3_i1.p1  ORF type:complete len:151 (-),score=15.69 TRINITY_DN3714_c0_g3_i1:56-508(-)